MPAESSQLPAGRVGRSPSSTVYYGLTRSSPTIAGGDRARSIPSSAVIGQAAIASGRDFPGEGHDEEDVGTRGAGSERRQRRGTAVRKLIRVDGSGREFWGEVKFFGRCLICGHRVCREMPLFVEETCVSCGAEMALTSDGQATVPSAVDGEETPTLSRCEHGFEEIGARGSCPACEAEEHLRELNTELAEAREGETRAWAVAREILAAWRNGRPFRDAWSADYPELQKAAPKSYPEDDGDPGELKEWQDLDPDC